MSRSIGVLRQASSRDSRVRQIAMPPGVRALSTLARIDYADAFLLETDPGEDRTAEQWARAVLEDAPMPLRIGLLSGWFSLGLRLTLTRSEGSVLGWEVRRNTPDLTLLGAGSSTGLPAELLFKRRRQTLLFSTFVQQQNAVARAVWAGVEPIHRPVVRRVLDLADRRYRP